MAGREENARDTESHENLQEHGNLPQKQKNSRGATFGKTIKHIFEPMFIEFNKDGQPCGRWRMDYITQLGVLSRNVDINIKEWSEVEQGFKNTIWLDSQNLWMEKEKQGEFIPSRMEDVLTVATNKKDHGGRTRGVGSRVGLQDHFGKPKTICRGQYFTNEALRLWEQQIATKVKNDTLAEMDVLMKEKIDQMNMIMEQKISQIMKHVGMKLLPETDGMSPTRPEHSSCHSIQLSPDPFDVIDVQTPCSLGVELLRVVDLVVVAKGMIWPTKVGAPVHSVPLMVDHVRVTFDEVIEPKALLPVPFLGFVTVGEVEGSNGQWPKKWVLIENEVPQNTMKKDNGKDKTKDSGKDTNGSHTNLGKEHLVEAEVYRTLGLASQNLHNMLARTAKDLKVYNVKCVAGVYSYEHDMKIHVTIDDIIQMFKFEWLNLSILWGRYLYEIGEQLGSNNIGFLCPQMLSSCAINPSEAETYIIDVLVKSQDKKFVMGAYFLVAFRVYCSKGGKHDVKKGNSLSWPKTECPQQPGSYECAYYVMKFMYNILMIHSKDEELTKCFKVSTLSMTDLNQVRDIWSEYFMDSCI